MGKVTIKNIFTYDIVADPAFDNAKMETLDDRKVQWLREYTEAMDGYTPPKPRPPKPTEPRINPNPDIDPYGEENWYDDDVPDYARNLLPVSMKIAAQTIGLDLVAVKPISSPRMKDLFVDFKYDKWTEEPKEPKGQIFSDIDPYGEEDWDA